MRLIFYEDFDMQKRVKVLSFSLVIGLLVGCETRIVSDIPKNTENWAVAVEKESNLYRLDRLFLRSEQLLPKDYVLLNQQGVKTIINLRFFDRNDDEKAFGNTDLTLVNTPLMSWSITPKDVAEVLWQVEQAQQRGAVLVHCYHGADRTGLISAVYRIIYQGWSIAEAKREMIEGPYGFHAIWRNIENFLTEQNIQEVREALKELGKKFSHSQY